MRYKQILYNVKNNMKIMQKKKNLVSEVVEAEVKLDD